MVVVHALIGYEKCLIITEALVGLWILSEL